MKPDRSILLSLSEQKFRDSSREKKRQRRKKGKVDGYPLINLSHGYS
jgi:hypothetical protein